MTNVTAGGGARAGSTNRASSAAAVGRIGAEVDEVGAVGRSGGTAGALGIDAAVERRDVARTQQASQTVESPAAGIAEHQVEIASPRGPM